MGLRKKPKHFISDRKPPEFALKSVYWIFWPILARFFLKTGHFKILTENRLSFPRKLFLFDSDENSPDFTQQPAHLSFCLKIARVCPETLAEQASDRKSHKPAYIEFLLGMCKLRHCHPYFDPNDLYNVWEDVKIIKGTPKGQIHINFPAIFSIWMILAPTQHVW